ncbi:MAG: protein-export chaperone SecB [Clostridiaceae bacterium]
MSNIASALRFIDYIVEKVEFYNNLSFNGEDIKLDFDISSNVKFIEDENNTFLLKLDLKIFENAEEKGYPFSMNLSVTGIFEIDNVDEDTKHSFAEMNSVAILFPYLRAIVSNYSANANVQPLILPPINVVQYMNEKKNKDISGGND